MQNKRTEKYGIMRLIHPLWHYVLLMSNLLLPPNLPIPTMVSATLVDSLKDPSQELLRLYNIALSEGISEDFPTVVSTHFSSLFSDDDALDQVGPPSGQRERERICN